jgi:hypothetical protein
LSGHAEARTVNGAFYPVQTFFYGIIGQAHHIILGTSTDVYFYGNSQGFYTKDCTSEGFYEHKKTI